jgi:8-oxo-dGTP pyrophosphatase MutT (NUDIX family)
MKTEYVLVFPYVGDGLDRRALVHLKTHGPMTAWGLNGFGGKIDGAETPEDAVHREIDEELGSEVTDVELLEVLRYPDAIVHVYKACLTGGTVCRLQDTPESRRSMWLEQYDINRIGFIWASGALKNLTRVLEAA